MSSGAPLNLTEPSAGTVNWATEMNTNLSAINTAIAALQAGGSAGPPGAKGDTGAVGMIFTGPWSSSVSYVPTDAVTFNGATYICTSSNVDAEPDTHPSSWATLSAAGATGPAGPAGPAGPSGGGTSVTFPITLIEGGTGVAVSSNAALRAALGIASSGANTDITSLAGIPGISMASVFGPTITVGSGSTELEMNSNGIVCSGGELEFATLILEPGTSGITTFEISPTTILSSTDSGGGTITLGADSGKTGPCPVLVNNGLLVGGATPPAAGAGQIGISGEIASTAGAADGTYLVISIPGGGTKKLALLAP